MSKKSLKFKQEYAYLNDEIVNSTKEYSRNKFLKKKSKHKDKKRLKNNMWDS